MKKVELVLVNKNPVINYLAGSLNDLDSIIWLYQDSNLNHLNNVEKLLRSNNRIKFNRKKIYSTNFKKNESIINKIKEKYRDYYLILNLSGYDQVACFTIYDALREVADQIFVIDQKTNSIIDLTQKQSDTIHTNLTVNEYIRLYGMKVRDSIHFDPKIGDRSRLTYFIGNKIDIVVPFLDKVREEITRHSQIKEKKWVLERKGIHFIIQKEDNNYSVNYGDHKNENEIELDKIGEEYLFRGEWLRELVFLRVNKSHFGDVRLNIKLDPDSIPKNKKLETIIDVALRRRCNFYIFQCFSYPISRNSFIALNAISRTIDELDAESFILLSHRPPSSFIARAHSAGIKIVYGQKIANFSI
ncbi:MAG: hypothetical protein K9M80_04400 [Candidatus Marinimicrobia bacterium]|nr:hypothetical protein [Candidatus Neomarinimicrobiota bacterium]